MPNEPQNSSTSKRVLLPLEPDFSQMSEPSINIARPSNTCVRVTGTHLLGVVEEICLKLNARQRRGEDTDLLLPSLLEPPLPHKRSKRSKKSKQKRRRRRSTSSSSSSNHSIQDYGTYKRTRLSPQVAEVPSTMQPVKIMDQTPVIHLGNVVQQLKNSGFE